MTAGSCAASDGVLEQRTYWQWWELSEADVSHAVALARHPGTASWCLRQLPVAHISVWEQVAARPDLSPAVRTNLFQAAAAGARCAYGLVPGADGRALTAAERAQASRRWASTALSWRQWTPVRMQRLAVVAGHDLGQDSAAVAAALTTHRLSSPLLPMLWLTSLATSHQQDCPPAVAESSQALRARGEPWSGLVDVWEVWFSRLRTDWMRSRLADLPTLAAQLRPLDGPALTFLARALTEGVPAQVALDLAVGVRGGPGVWTTDRGPRIPAAC